MAHKKLLTVVGAVTGDLVGGGVGWKWLDSRSWRVKIKIKEMSKRRTTTSWSKKRDVSLTGGVGATMGDLVGSLVGEGCGSGEGKDAVSSSSEYYSTHFFTRDSYNHQE